MKRGLLLALIATSGCAGAPIPRDRLQEPGALIFNGYTNPRATCYRCHGGDGTGRFLRGPDLADRVPGLTRDQIRTAIFEGKGFMPSFGDRLSSQEIDTLVSWLQQRFGKAAR